MTILTEQEIVQLSDENLGSQLTEREFVRVYKFARAIEAAVIAKIKAQGPEVRMADCGSTQTNEDVGYIPNWTDYYRTPLYRLPEGEKE